MTVDVLVMYIQTYNKHIQHRRIFTDTDISIYGSEELRYIVSEGMRFNSIPLIFMLSNDILSL